jgi:hypothetical protein
VSLLHLRDFGTESSHESQKCIPPGLNGLRKKSERKANLAKYGLAGAKARLILLTLSARLNRLRKKSERKENLAKDGLAGAEVFA